MEKKKAYRRSIIRAMMPAGVLMAVLFSCEWIEYDRIIILQTGSPTEESYNSAKIKGELIDLGESKITQHGHCWSKSEDPTNNLTTRTTLGPKSTRGTFISDLTDLSPDTKYYVRAYATDARGMVTYGDQKTFTTKVNLKPEAEFMASSTSTNAGVAIQFYDLSSNNPVNWYWDFGDGLFSEVQHPIHVYESVGIYSVSLTVSNTYGTDTEIKINYITVSENSITRGTFIDSRDEHEYAWIRIGEQVWMAENLAYLPFVSPSGINSLTDRQYYVYNYEGTLVSEAKSSENFHTYGVLYNWPAAMAENAGSAANPSGVQGVCPDGWHLPSIAEWDQLTDYLGGDTLALLALKESGTEHWISPNEGTNSSGFTALPGGAAFYDEGFDDLDFAYLYYYGFWWVTDEYYGEFSYLLGIGYDNPEVTWYYDNKRSGHSIRCVEDSSL